MQLPAAPLPSNTSTICVSGGMDPIHKGHVRMINEAAQYGKVIVILNSDAWLTRKKGKPFMSFEERKEILEALRCVDRVEAVDDSDGTVCEALSRLKPTYFANGGDRDPNRTPSHEIILCNQLGIGLLFGIGGGKVQSSSDLISSSQK